MIARRKEVSREKESEKRGGRDEQLLGREDCSVVSYGGQQRSHVSTDRVAHLNSSAADPASAKDDFLVLVGQVLDDGLPQAIELEVWWGSIISWRLRS